jgi:hypothetical protein
VETVQPKHEDQTTVPDSGLAGGGEALGGRDAVELRHAYVHQHHIGCQAQYLVDGLQAGCRLPYDSQVLGGIHDAT